MQGVIAAAPTPIDQNFNPIKELFLEHCAWALTNGCEGLNILGSTGEANSFDIKSRQRIMTYAIEGLPKNRLMVGTATPSLKETIFLTECADDLGYEIALVLPPYYYSPVSDEGLLRWYKALHQALGQRRIKIYFYNYPQMTGIFIPLEVISELVKFAPERFSGIKDSSGDLNYCRAIATTNDAIGVFPSSESALVNAFKDGFSGCISATVNVTASLAGKIWAQKEAPPPDLCADVLRLRDILVGPNLIANVKSLIADRTKDTRWLETLPPIQPHKETNISKLKIALGE
tara:strand:+ start:594 stop:1460 length:867 start_codon:yes stop_codon:yes gene_type:complete